MFAGVDRVHGFMGFIGEFGNMNSNVVLLIGQMEIIASLIVIGLVVQKLKLFDIEVYRRTFDNDVKSHCC